MSHCRRRGAKRIARYRSLFLIVFFFLGCAHYTYKIREPRELFESGQHEKAIEKLKLLASQEGDSDELLYLLDLGMVYHSSGRYKEAIETFLKADRIAEIKDYKSISEEALSIVLSEGIKPYKGEHFEKILINVYLAIDYALSHQWDDALVECRKVNHKLDLMISEGGLPYEKNAFAKYLAGTLFEARREWNDAFVDYRQLLKWNVSFPYLGGSLLRLSDRLKATQEFDDYKKMFPDIKDYKIAKGESEIILLFEQGKSPIKTPSPDFHRVPTFYRRHYGGDYVWVNVAGKRVRTHPLFDIEGTAIKELEHRISLIIAKKIGGIVLKELISHQVEKQTKSEALGALTSAVLHAIDQPDLRSWTTLPANLQLARVTVPEGKHSITIDLVTHSGEEKKSVKIFESELSSKTKTFLNYRNHE